MLGKEMTVWKLQAVVDSGIRIFWDTDNVVVEDMQNVSITNLNI